MTRAASVFLLVPALVPALLLQSCGSESRAPSMAPRQEEQKNEDGYYRGQPAKQDVYAWKARARFSNGEETTLAGDVTLLR